MRAKHVVLIGGPAGSGKTELGNILARKTNWAVLDKDSLTQAVVEESLKAQGLSPDDRESEFYRTRLRPAEYQALMHSVLDNMRCGNGVVATAPFTSEFHDTEWLMAVQSECQSMGMPLRIVWVRCDVDTMRAQILRRGAPRDSGKLADWDNYASQLDLDFQPAISHTIFRNPGDRETLIRRAHDLLTSITG